MKKIRNILIVFTIMLSLTANAQRTTFGFYKVGMCQVDADSYYTVGDTSFVLVNGEIRYVGNYVTFDYGDKERFYSVVETKHSGNNHSHVLWSTQETVVAYWHDNDNIMGLIATEPQDKFDNTLTLIIHYLTKTTQYKGKNKYPGKDEIKIIVPKKKENKSIY